MYENTQNNAPASGDEQMQNGNVDEAAETQPSSTQDDNLNINDSDKEPAKRAPYDGTKKLPRTKAESMATINACNGQIGRVDLRAASLINSHDVAKAKYAEASDFEAKREIVLADQKVVSELSDMRGYKSELESWKNELLKAEEAEINSYDFGELSW
jgi:hypothetical protein